ncbi:hypothetical protein MSAN_01037100 [Mycena sanguinolenta]|uniref:Gamma-tubulin complex component 5 n=1 Tax=Mycena sanguinolenta TaxID=230812 RepID=A0A8H7D8V5_9AGAR|nr:hypothetical protein MSAN_01037100 [Mycena sanguinolenta]
MVLNRVPVRLQDAAVEQFGTLCSLESTSATNVCFIPEATLQCFSSTFVACLAATSIDLSIRRPPSRWLSPLCHALVKQVTGLSEGDDFQTAVEYASRSLESTTMVKAATGVDMGIIDRQIRGHSHKARIQMRDTLAEALQSSYSRLKHQAAQEHDLDQEIKMSRLPDHMQFLLSLATSATPATLAFADTYLDAIKNPPPPPAGLTWADIFGDDIPEAESSNSSPSLSPLNSDDLELDDDDDGSFSSLDSEDAAPPATPTSAQVSEPSRPPYTYAHRKEFEQLQAGQYWREGYVWRGDKGKARAFDIGDASTLGPALQKVLAHEQGTLGAVKIQRERYIDEQDAVREILMALQGRKNIMLALIDGVYTETYSTPRLIHLSLTSQSSLISILARTATTAQQLRTFVSFVFSASSSQFRAAPSRIPRMARTLEAFADAVDTELRALDRWCAAREESICRLRAGGAPAGTKLVVSLLSTEKALQDTFENGLEVLLDTVHAITSFEYHRFALLPRTPAVLSALLLDTLLDKVQVHREQGDGGRHRGHADACVRGVRGAGMGVRQGEDLPEEFFIEGGFGLSLLDPEFWAEGYLLRDGVVRGDEDEGDEASSHNARAIPSFLEHVAIPVLSSGKAVGLLRALGVPPTVDGPTSLSQWRSFGALLSSSAPLGQQLSSVSVDALSRLVYDELAPHCEAAGAILGRILVDECELLRHLSSVEDLFLMRKGDALSNFTDLLFAKMDSQQAWGDFHFLNTAFRDVVEAGTHSGGKEWIQPSLVRLSYRGTTDMGKSVGRTVRAIGGLLLEYAVPFPIAYIFPPRILQVYGEVFVFLLQIRRAKSMLERILVRGGTGRDERLGNELKAFYAIRSRLSWFINTILNFLTTHVIHTQVVKFHDIFNKAKSLDEMIRVHDEHIERIRGRCLLQPDTSALHRAILSVLDMSLHFCEVFTTFAGDTTVTLDVSRLSVISKRHRSRRQRSQRKNIVSFSHAHVFEDSDDESSNDEDDEVDLEDDHSVDASFSMAAESVSSSADGYSRIDKMATELDGLVVQEIRFPHRALYHDAQSSYGPGDVIRPLITDEDTFDIAVSVWLRAPEDEEAESKRLNVPDVPSDQLADLDNLWDIWMGLKTPDGRDTYVLEKPLFSDVVFRGLRLSDKHASAKVDFRLPLARFLALHLEDSDLRATFLLLPSSPSLIDHVKNFSSWIPDSLFPKRRPIRSWPFPLDSEDRGEKTIADLALESFSFSIPLLEFHDAASQCTDDSGVSAANPSAPEVVAGHPYVVTRTQLRIVRETNLFNATVYNNIRDDIKENSCGQDIPYLKPHLKWCQRTYKSIGNLETLLKLEVPTESGVETQWAYAPYLDTKEHATGPLDIIPLPVNRENCAPPNEGNGSIDISWRIAFAGRTPAKQVLADTYVSPQLIEHNATELKRLSQQDEAELWNGAFGHRFHDDAHPRRRIGVQFISWACLAIYGLLQFYYWWTRVSTVGISVSGATFSAVGLVLDPIVEALQNNDASLLFIVPTSLIVPYLMCKCIMRVEFGWKPRLFPATHQERASQRIDNRTSWRTKLGLLAAFVAVFQLTNPQKIYLISTTVPAPTPEEFPESMLLDFLRNVCNALLSVGTLCQVLLNHRSRAYGGGYRAEVVMYFLASIISLLYFVPAVVGRMEMRQGLTPFTIIHLGMQLPLVWQALTLPPVKAKEDEDE